MDFSNLDKVCTYKDGRVQWETERCDNLVYLLSFEDGYYIGSTTNIRRRLSQYIADLTHNKYINVLLQGAFNKSETFEVFCLEWVNDKTRLTQREQFYIDVISPNLNKKTAFADKPRKERTKSQLKVQTLCKEKGMTLQDVASKLGITYQSLYDCLKGNPTLKRLQRIASILGVSVKDLFEDDYDTSALKCPHCGKPLNIKIE